MLWVGRAVLPYPAMLLGDGALEEARGEGAETDARLIVDTRNAMARVPNCKAPVVKA